MNDKTTLLGILDRVQDHLLCQGRKADNILSCLYRVFEPDGSVLKCAVGCLVADEHYTPLIEGCGIPDLVVTNDGVWASSGSGLGVHLAHALNASGVPATLEVHSLLCHLQSIHDNVAVKYWPANLEKLRSSLRRNQ